MQRIYPSNFEKKIGFDQVRELLSTRCLSALGKENVERCEFSKSHDFVEKQIEETLEFLSIINGEDNFPISTFSDSRSALKKAKIEGTFLEVHELFELKRSLETIRGIVHFFEKKEPEEFPRLRAVLKDVKLYPFVYDRINQIVTKHGKIKDNASPELNQIRREILSRQASVSKAMQAILRKAQTDGIVDKDTAVSIRDGRAVIPVPASYKRKMKGIVHDESATGKTAYIEPAEIVETNNAIRELEYAERREIVKILTDFTNAIRPYIEELLYTYQILGQLDFIRAKAMFSKESEAIKPKLFDKPLIGWSKARHPLLERNLKAEGRAIVPLNISLNEKGRILLISGPNAGGKSVCLKTTGLLQYMLQCGMPIPVEEESEAGVFDNLFIDIGDEQSIENDLSTYSSHLMNMKFFSRNCQERTLILIDEFGTGTEPALGGAIAEAVLNDLNKKGTFGVITTHYTNLKHFASSDEGKGIENGAMLYDSHKMEPLFQLEIGKPGSSFAFEIARKIGLPESILAEATEKLGEDHINFDKHLREISRDKRYWETKRQKIRKVEKRLDELADDYKTNLQETNKMRKEIIEKAKKEAEKILADSNKSIERTIREIKESQAEKERTKKARKNLETFKEQVFTTDNTEDEKVKRKMEKLRQKEERRQKGRPKEEKENASKPGSLTGSIKKAQLLQLTVGAKVRLKDGENVGEVIEISGNNVTIAFGMLRSVVKQNKLVVVSNSQAKKMNTTKNATMGKINDQISHQKLRFKPEIDVRGERAEDALRIIQDYLDEAIMVEAKEIKILHGKGNGILREMIRKFLKAEPIVKSVKDEHVQFGGAGISVVKLDM